LKKQISILYFLWIVISIIFLVMLTYKFFPVYKDNEFPLFTDITLIIFLPSFFALVWLIVHFINVFIKIQTLKITVAIIFLTIAFIYSLNLMEFSLFFRVLASFIGLVIAFIHYFITELIYKKCLLVKENV